MTVATMVVGVGDDGNAAEGPGSRRPLASRARTAIGTAREGRRISVPSRSARERRVLARG
jgi:hypothetical protein